MIHEVAIDPEIYGSQYFIKNNDNNKTYFKLSTDLKM